MFGARFAVWIVRGNGADAFVIVITLNMSGICRSICSCLSALCARDDVHRPDESRENAAVMPVQPPPLRAGTRMGKGEKIKHESKMRMRRSWSISAPVHFISR
jgi:hypothetical protein